jgi:hypothetical protein
VALVGCPLTMSSSSSSSGSPERTGAGAVSASRASFEASAYASRRARSGASFADTVSALPPAVGRPDGSFSPRRPRASSPRTSSPSTPCTSPSSTCSSSSS